MSFDNSLRGAIIAIPKSDRPVKRKKEKRIFSFHFTQDGVPVVHVFDAHLNVFNAEVHLQVLQMEIPLGVAFHFAGLDVDLGFDALCESRKPPLS